MCGFWNFTQNVAICIKYRNMYMYNWLVVALQINIRTD